VAYSLTLPADEQIILAPMVVSAMAAAGTQVINAALRGQRRFGREAVIGVVTTSLYSAMGIAAALLWKSAVVLAFAAALASVLGFALAIRAVVWQPRAQEPYSFVASVRRLTPYAVLPFAGVALNH